MAARPPAGVTAMQPVIAVSHLSKIYASGFRALNDINLDIRRGEIFALLGPNGAGKTTLISTVCGIVNPSEGKVTVAGHDIVTDYRAARAMIGLVPQELTTDAFETVWATVSFSRGLFGRPKNPAHVEKVLKSLSLWASAKAAPRPGLLAPSRRGSKTSSSNSMASQLSMRCMRTSA